MTDEARLFEPEEPVDDRPAWQRPAIDASQSFVGRDHPETAKAMQRKALPRWGSFRRRIYELLASEPATDDELEVFLHRSHQSVSGARSTLKSDGHVEDSGLRRPNRYGHQAVVWRVKP